jgi:primase-polymerase (primpol)-like protein
MTKPQTFNGDLASLPPALAPLMQLPCWVVWKWEQRKSKWTKPPYRASDPDQPAKSNDASTWNTYDAALTAFSAGACDGIGFMLRDAQLGAGDLDHVRDPATGTLLNWAEQRVLEAPRLRLQVIRALACPTLLIEKLRGGVSMSL